MVALRLPRLRRARAEETTTTVVTMAATTVVIRAGTRVETKAGTRAGTKAVIREGITTTTAATTGGTRAATTTTEATRAVEIPLPPSVSTTIHRLDRRR